MIASEHPNDALIVDGIRYRMTQGGAIVTAVETKAAGIQIPSFIKDPNSGEQIPVCDFDKLNFAQFAGRCTVFTEKEGTVARLCELYGYSYVLTDSDTVRVGDITGDDSTDHQDVIVLQRYLTESAGFRLTDAQLNAVDMNQDGGVDLNDLLLMMQRLAPPTETAGIANLDTENND